MTNLIIAAGPVIVENDKVLLNKHGDTTFYKFCGGQREANDSLIETAKREFLEEMGAQCEIVDPTPFLLHTIKQTSDGPIDVILVHYLAKRTSDIHPGPDIREWAFVPLTDLDPNDLAPNIIPALKHFGII